jgi:hemolysin D
VTPAARFRDGAWGNLVARHAAVFAAAWHARKAMDGVRRDADEIAFLPAALSLRDTPVHPAPRRVGYLLMALLVIAVAWAWIGEIDIVAVAPGRIIVGERSKVVQPLERSVVQRVLVKDGDHVQAGQALVELDATEVRADKAGVLDQRRSALSDAIRARLLRQALQTPPTVTLRVSTALLHEAAGSIGPAPAPEGVHEHEHEHEHERERIQKQEPTLAAERNRVQAQLAAEWSDIVAQRARFAAELRHRQAAIATARVMLAKLEATLPMIRKREDDMRALVAQGFISHHAGQDRTRERIEMERDIATGQARLHEATASHAESVSSLAGYVAQTRRDLSERETLARQRLAQSRQELVKALQRERLTVLRSPVAGVVQQLATHTVGGVVTEAQPLMVIVPDEHRGGQIVAEVTLENKDIGFVHAGQVAEVKLETFVFTRYGTVPATVELVTSDAVQDEQRGAIFPARLLLSKNTIDVDGKSVRLGPGMNVTAEIKTGKRRVIDFLLSPIQKAGSESLRER